MLAGVGQALAVPVQPRALAGRELPEAALEHATFLVA